MLKRLLAEPLVHFIAVALIIFAAYGILVPSSAEKPDRIVITVAKIDQLAEVFAKSWQRKPSTDELKGLVDDYVKEEIYYREAKALRLDVDDTVIRRRLRTKMEFLNDAAIDTLKPTDAELETYLKAHPADFEIESMLAFQQVFLYPEKHGDKIDQDAAAILAVLEANPATDPSTLGDASLLPSELPLTNKTSIRQSFGEEFSGAVDKLTPGQWSGPVKSEFGLHIVRVSERKAGHLPNVGEVRDAVVREWSNAKRHELEAAGFNELLKRYQVTIETAPGEGAVQ